MKQHILKEIFDKKIELDKDSFDNYGNIDRKVYRTNVNGESYDFIFEYKREHRCIDISFVSTTTDDYEDMPNDGRVFDVMAKIKFFLKSYLHRFAEYIESNKDEWSEEYLQKYTINGFKFLPVATASDYEKYVDIISRKRARLYIAFFKKSFPSNFNVKIEREYIYLLFDKPMSPEELLALL